VTLDSRARSSRRSAAMGTCHSRRVRRTASMPAGAGHRRQPVGMNLASGT
jgi:hypothetical protein